MIGHADWSGLIERRSEEEPGNEVQRHETQVQFVLR